MPDFASADVTFLSEQKSGNDTTGYSFSGVSLGAAASDRYIIATVHATASGRTIASVTIGGVTATDVLASNLNYGIFIANVPTGDTGDVVVTLDAGGTSMHVGLWRITGLVSATADDTDDGRGVTGSDTPTGTLSIDVSVGAGGGSGFAIASCGQTGPADPISATWTEVTENFDSAAETTVNAFTGGSKTYTVAQTLSIACTYSDTALQARMAATWSLTAVAATAVPSGEIIFFQ